MVCLSLKPCLVNCFSLAELFQRFLKQKFLKNIHKDSEASLQKDIRHQMQLHQHKAIFVLLELVLLWHYLNNDCHAFIISIRSPQGSI